MTVDFSSSSSSSSSSLFLTVLDIFGTRTWRLVWIDSKVKIGRLIGSETNSSMGDGGGV